MPSYFRSLIASCLNLPIRFSYLSQFSLCIHPILNLILLSGFLLWSLVTLCLTQFSALLFLNRWLVERSHTSRGPLTHGSSGLAPARYVNKGTKARRTRGTKSSQGRSIKSPMFIVLATWWKIYLWVSPALGFLPEKTKCFLFRYKDCS